MKKEEFLKLTLMGQVNNINKLMDQGQSFNKICIEIGISTGIRNKFILHGYKLINKQYIQIGKAESNHEEIKEEEQKVASKEVKEDQQGEHQEGEFKKEPEVIKDDEIEEYKKLLRTLIKY